MRHFAAGNLSTDSGCRRLVPADIWTRLKAYFPDAPEFSINTEECDLCKVRLHVNTLPASDALCRLVSAWTVSGIF